MTNTTETKGVVVTLAGPTDTTFNETHPEGDEINIKEGHLEVKNSAGRSGNGATLAWYAPGRWISAAIKQ